MHPLDGPTLKLDRAHEHLDQLEAEFRSFLRLNPYEVIPQPNPEEGLDMYRLKVTRSPPARLGIIIGDAIHNLRSALNHLAWQLALLKTATPDRRTEFPIFIDPNAKGLKKRMADFRPEARVEIERLQPYHRLNPGVPVDFLWAIHELSNLDKHRNLAIISYGLVISMTTSAGKRPSLTLIGRFEDGTEIPMPAFPAQFQSQVNFKVEPTLAVVFKEGGPEGFLPVNQIGPMYHFVRNEVFPRFVQFFP